MPSTVLIVDDEFSGRQTLESVLEGDGYNIEMAENGMQALEMVRRIQPDVVLLDVMMPGMTGFEVCQKIRSDPLVAEVPIIVLTALDDRDALLSALKAGADDFITKPFDRYELRARLIGITKLNRYHKLLEERSNIQNAHSKLLKAYEATIKGWSHAMDLRDRETEGHSYRVAELAVELAKEYGLDENELYQIQRGALLHDMGKLGIPDHILHKPGTLTDEEWDVMKKHPQFAYEMLYPIEYLRPALDIPYCHHEKWDGTGYPRGLQGGEIPVSARIFAIVDVWDALTSDRPYRSAWTKDKAIVYIKEQSGKHFDPAIVDLFLKFISRNADNNTGQ
jgi:putative two-component system response regulator